MDPPCLLYAYHISPSGQIFVAPIVTPLLSLLLVFSLNLSDNKPSHLFVLNPHQSSPGAAFLNMEYPSLNASAENVVRIPGQMASCWATYAPQFDAIIGSARPNIITISPATGNVRGQTSLRQWELGGVMRKVDRNWLYLSSDDDQVGS